MVEMKRTALSVRRERAVLVGVVDSDERVDSEDPLEELERLAETAGATVADKIIQKRKAISPAYYVGSGKAREIADAAKAMDIDVIIFDNELSPAQVRNLEKTTDTKVIDRSELILDIFATRARTLQAKLQVELAQLEYALPRLTKMWTHLSRIEGGIGTRGPGEQQLEVDRRLVRTRIKSLQGKLHRIEKRRQQQVRSRADAFTVSLVGYTNAGKSTLMNALTDARAFVEDKLFATLDTRTRVWPMDMGCQVLLSDTVGFIRKLPHHLVASFHATLEEVCQADLLLHIVDVSHPNAMGQVDSVQAVLEELGVEETPTVMCFNKEDALNDRTELRVLQNRFPSHVIISALKQTGLDELSSEVATVLKEQQIEMTLAIPASDGGLAAKIERSANVLHREYVEDRAYFRVLLKPEDLEMIRRLSHKIEEIEP